MKGTEKQGAVGMDKKDWSSLVKRLEDLVAPSKSGFLALDDGGERYGSWTRTWIRREGDLSRYVLFGVTPLGRDTDSAAIVEVAAGADSATSRKFTRRVVFDHKYTGLSTLLDGLEAEISSALWDAMTSASSLKRDQLTESYSSALPA